MSKSEDGLSSLIKQLGSPKIDGSRLADLLKPVDLVDQVQGNSEPSAKAASPTESKTVGMNAKDASTGILFGSPSNSRNAGSQSSSEWSNLLKQTASGGLATALGGGLGLAGLGGLVTGILGLFGGGKSTPPPLVEFQLPDTQQQTVYVSSSGSAAYQGTDVVQASSPGSSTGIYASTNPTGTRPVPLQYQSTQIAQAVKNALLTSSSLNDVIAEI